MLSQIWASPLGGLLALVGGATILALGGFGAHQLALRFGTRKHPALAAGSEVLSSVLLSSAKAVYAQAWASAPVSGPVGLDKLRLATVAEAKARLPDALRGIDVGKILQETDTALGDLLSRDPTITIAAEGRTVAALPGSPALTPLAPAEAVPQVAATPAAQPAQAAALQPDTGLGDEALIGQLNSLLGAVGSAARS